MLTITIERKPRKPRPPKITRRRMREIDLLLAHELRRSAVSK